MFLPCRPCCVCSGTSCTACCPAKTNTIRLSISASDYTWSCPIKIGGVGHNYYFLMPGASLAGTFDLTSSDGITYEYTYSACGGQSPKLTVVLTSGVSCSTSLKWYCPLRVDSPASCAGGFDDLATNYFSGTVSGASTFHCSGQIFSIDAAKVLQQTTVGLNNIWTPDEAVANYPYLSQLRDAATSANVAFFGYRSGIFRQPNGTPTSSGSSIITASNATFV